MSEVDAKLNHSGAIGLLCELSLMLRPGHESDELRDNIERCVSDWCAITGWSYKRILQRIEVFPPQ
jgi:hypothetical protein